MVNFSSSKKFIWVFVIIALLAIAIVAAASLWDKYGNNVTVKDKNQANEKPEFKVERKDVPEAQLPDKFPNDLPIEKTAKVIENFNSTVSNGNFQATRQYESSKSPDANYRAFETFFRSNNWEFLTTSQASDTKTITVKKGNTIIQSLFYINSVSKASIVKVNVNIIP